MVVLTFFGFWKKMYGVFSFLISVEIVIFPYFSTIGFAPNPTVNPFTLMRTIFHGVPTRQGKVGMGNHRLIVVDGETGSV